MLHLSFIHSFLHSIQRPHTQQAIPQPAVQSPFKKFPPTAKTLRNNTKVCQRQPTSITTKQKSRRSKQKPVQDPEPVPAASIESQTPEMSVRRILVVGLGNPGEAYRNTYHSAGNIVLNALRNQMADTQPSFKVARHGKKSTEASIGPKYSFLQSPCVMNVTGTWFARAYREHLIDNGLSPAELGVVLVHDDLEEELGVVKIRDWARSHRGHNGIKSVNASLKADPEGKWARVSIGIGRPVERERASVSDYVLSKIPRHARGILEEKGGAGLLAALMDLERKWEAS